MLQRKLSLFIATFPYAGNSTGTTLCWPTALWLIKTVSRIKTDPKFTSRIHDTFINGYADTPITMTRNAAIADARWHGADLLLMLDSDMEPDVHLGEPNSKPFMDAAFDRIYEMYDKGPRLVAAPYGGAPPHENAFEFMWSRHANLGDEAAEETMYMSGIQEAAACATGLIMYDMRCFDIISPPYFRYEWTDATETKKASTEDVQNTRDISLAGIQQLGYNPVEVAWDSWSGHRKNWCVKKPQVYTSESVSKNLAGALARRPIGERKVQLENVLGDVETWFPEVPHNRISEQLCAVDGHE
jgi:hypothetical protein